MTEQSHHDVVVEQFVEADHIANIKLNKKGAMEKFGHFLQLYVLDALDHHRKIATETGLPDAYPSDDWVLLEDKLDNKQPKKLVNTTSGKPRKQRLPPKKGRRSAPVVDEESDAESEPEPEVEEEEEKPKPKKQIVTLQRTSKAGLHFMVTRFVYEIYSTDGGDSLDGAQEFTEFVLNNVSKDFDSQVSRVIIPVVNRLGSSVGYINDRKFTVYLTQHINELFDDRQNMSGHVTNYITNYFKVLADAIARMMWVKRQTVNWHAVESVMRILDMGTHEYLVEQGVSDEEVCDHGLEQGILKIVRDYVLAMCPPAVKKTKSKAKKEESKPKPKPVIDDGADDSDDEPDDAQVEDDSDAEVVHSDSDEEEPAPRKKKNPLRKLKKKKKKSSD